MGIWGVMSSEHASAISDHINRAIDQVQIERVELSLSQELIALLKAHASEGGWTFEEILNSAFAHGAALLAEPQPDGDQTSNQSDVLQSLVRRIHAFRRDYAALKFQVYKLHNAILVEETRLAGIRGQNDTFEDLTCRLRDRIQQYDENRS